MIYDCLFFKGKDIRGETIFKKRYEYIYKLLDEINPKEYHKIKQYEGDYNIVKIKKHFRDEIVKFYDVLDKNMKKLKSNDIYISNKDGWNALHIAARANAVPILDRLHQHSQDLVSKSISHSLPLPHKPETQNS